jgi:hypothetical protein
VAFAECGEASNAPCHVLAPRSASDGAEIRQPGRGGSDLRWHSSSQLHCSGGGVAFPAELQACICSPCIGIALGKRGRFNFE